MLCSIAWLAAARSTEQCRRWRSQLPGFTRSPSDDRTMAARGHGVGDRWKRPGIRGAGPWSAGSSARRCSDQRLSTRARTSRAASRSASERRLHPSVSRRSPSSKHRAHRRYADPLRCIEFNDEIACIDVLYDLAFLLMDLWRRQLPRHANAILNTYLSETLDFEGIRLLPLFLSCRAAVRAKTSATAAALETDPKRRGELEETARAYLALAGTLLRPAAARLIAIGGFSGSGKSTLAYTAAQSIGAAPGALVIRSDEVRKQLCGVSALTHLGPSGYTADVTRRVTRRRFSVRQQSFNPDTR